jgi:nucleoside-diphosphate-sugar epimerase
MIIILFPWKVFLGVDMKALITGAEGFVCSYLAQRFLEDGPQVVVVDNQSTGGPAEILRVITESSKKRSCPNS